MERIDPTKTVSMPLTMVDKPKKINRWKSSPKRKKEKTQREKKMREKL